MLNWIKQLNLRLRSMLVVGLVCMVSVSAPPSGYQQSVNFIKAGIASFYGTANDGFLGRKTASGYILTQECLFAAHPTLPFGTELLVTNTRTGLAVVVTVRDRGPYTKGRIIDLSYRAAQIIGLDGVGIAQVSIDRFIH